MANELRILYAGRIYPDVSGASLRTYNIAKISSATCDTTIYATDPYVEYRGNIQNVNIIQEKRFSNLMDASKYYFNRLFQRNFDLRIPSEVFSNVHNAVFQIEEPYFYNILKKNDIKTYILNEHNVYWEFSSFPNYDLKMKIYRKLASERDKLIEMKALNGAAHIISCSERDKQIIINNIPETRDKITVIPNCVAYREYEKHLQNNRFKNSNEFYYVLFIGTLSYPPNRDAVNLICNDIAPRFGVNIKFIIVGRNPPNISKPDNVVFTGYVDDAKKCIQGSDVCIAPLRYGSGTRLKILEYMAMGKPVISTSKGAEGIDYTNNKNIIIEDDLDAFSEKIRILLDDKNMRDNLGKNAIDLIKKKYDWEIYRKTLHDVYESCM